jgi:hypothetical protein
MVSGVLTSGRAGGYMELADNYEAGARMNKSQALAFRHQAMAYRTTASRLALQFAQNVEKMDQVPAGAILMDFPLPIGTAAAPPQFTQIAKGVELAQADEEAALALAIQRNVLLAACLVAGAPKRCGQGRGDSAKRVGEHSARPSPTPWPKCWTTSLHCTHGTSWTIRGSWRSSTSTRRVCWTTTPLSARRAF